MTWTSRPSPRLSAVAAAVLVLGTCAGNDQSIEEFIEDTWPEGSSGTVVAARGGEAEVCTGIGMADREQEIPADCGTVYDIMSMTKQFTAAAILKLQMMGELQVTDPISTHLGPVPDDKSGITVHHLLTHSAGLPEGLGDDYDPLSREDMVAQALESEPLAPPGEEYHYSNTGYSLLAAIVEEASGLGYEEFLAAHLFTPTGMTQTGYVLPEWDPDRVAVEYNDQGEPQGRPFEHPWDEDGPYWNLRGNGGLLSTAEDMVRWHLALEGEEVLDEHAKDLMFEPHILEYEGEDTYYGYGWVIQSADDYGEVAWHDGGNGWSLGLITRFLDDGMLVFTVSNHAYQEGEWNLEEVSQDLTLGIAERLREGE